ncbi:hypothetical protein EJ357_22615 [Streptomyces cyaneochromogenes]|uniref:DUF5753 domain-containing protein n=1 Tax=Streptomyces cyaneochromogenes TaxID=2496836 RepID=A0A3Q9ETY7_9ACTN|nr:DUF5753 domain-containing protein [Streptomyces cyaneochromogenes]AZQ35927.1 hypothetical protein EJ357_22615 [Streptomyces cyaneochromogenes]
MTAIFDSPAETLGEHIGRLAAIEGEADTVQAWQPMLIPGLLQSYAYACAAIHATAPALPLEVVSERAEARRHRIDRLGRPGARSVAVIVDESALYRPVGGYAALADQLEHLLALEALQPSLSVRVLPQGIEAHPGLAGAFTLYRAAGQRAVFVESLTSSEITTRPDDVAAYSSTWDRLRGLALSPQESVELIDGTRETLCRRLQKSR